MSIDQNTFIEDLKDIFEDLSAEITTDTKFKSLEEWDSMTALSLIAMLDEKYNVEISSQELQSIHTVDDLYKLTLQKS